MKMVKIFANGAVETVPFTKSLKKLQEHVGGYIQCINGVILGNYVMLVDEEGRLKEGRVYNAIATKLSGHVIVGDALLLKESGMEFRGIDDALACELAASMKDGKEVK